MSRPTDGPTSGAEPTRGRVTNSVTISGGSFAGNVIGAGHVSVGAMGGAGDQPTVADLSARLAAVRELVVAAGTTPETRAKIAYELGEMLASLSEEKPEPGPVVTRWKAVQKLVGGVAAAGTAVAATVKEITEMITAVFGGS